MIPDRTTSCHRGTAGTMPDARRALAGSDCRRVLTIQGMPGAGGYSSISQQGSLMQRAPLKSFLAEVETQEASPRFGNRSLSYSCNDTETPKHFILQGHLGIEACCANRDAGASEKSFSHNCYPRPRFEGNRGRKCPLSNLCFVV
jgi:hypothetical protein